MDQICRGRFVLDVEQDVDIRGGQRGAAPVVEFGHARMDSTGFVEHPQVAVEESAADDQHTLITQRRELAARGHQFSWVQNRQ